MKRRQLLKAGIPGAMALIGLPHLAFARSKIHTLRFHQFMPPIATIPAKILRPWAKTLADRTDGRLHIQFFDSMSLGGRPPELMDQARDGVVDISLSLLGYTPGRFPRTEVFELPFMMTDPVATSLALQQLVDTNFKNNEYADYKVLGTWVHGPGVIHSREPIAKLEDMRGKRLRGPSRVINDMISELGATPVGMPLPAIPEALSRGVIGGTFVPWEITPSLHLSELVTNHTEFGGPEAIYTATFAMVMNKKSYASLPDDLREALDAESGKKFAETAGRIVAAGDKPGRAIAEREGNNIIRLDETEVMRWKKTSQPVYTRWLAEMKDKRIDGEALINQARGLIARYSR